jgi:hypothetical protein
MLPVGVELLIERSAWNWIQILRIAKALNLELEARFIPKLS